jgi:hypothetical protein
MPPQASVFWLTYAEIATKLGRQPGCRSPELLNWKGQVDAYDALCQKLR